MYRGPSKRVLAFIAAVSASTAAIVPLANSARGDLDRIAADGVTEVGGSAAYARMLPRTGPDGRLAASLLPPVADWASQPISNLYYVAGNSPVQGNGSPQYPFNTLTYAFSHMAPQSALLLAPATYSGTLSLGSGNTVTIIGLGPSSYISSLTVAASGSSPSTKLILAGVHVGTLTLTGGRIEVSLSHSIVARLAGSTTAATVTRTDLGAVIGVSSLTHTDVYAGYATVPNAVTLRDRGGASSLSLADGRALVDSGGTVHTVAYLSDVAAATNNGLYAEVRGLQATNTAISARIDQETAALQARDTELASRITAETSALSLQIAGVGTSWIGQLSTLSRAVTRLQDEVAGIQTIDTNTIVALEQSVAALGTAYKAADTVLRTSLNSLSSTVATLSGSLSSTIDTRATAVADARITARQPAIVSNATAAVDTKINDARTELTSQIDANYNTLSMRIADAESQLSRIGTAEDKLNTLIRQLARANNGSSFTNAYQVTLPAPYW